MSYALISEFESLQFIHKAVQLMSYVMVISEPWMQEEVKQYEKGRRKLAQLMNEDPESFSEAQVLVCLS